MRGSIEKVLVEKSVRCVEYPFGDFPGVFGVELGETDQGVFVRVPRNDLVRHLLAVGQSGSGKTTLFYNLMDQLDRPFWCFDLKQDYRHLVQENSGLLVLPWTRLRFNPLKPPKGVGPRRWAQVFSEIFGHATNLLSGSKNYLMKKIVELYRLYGLFTRVSPPFPCLHDLELLIHNDKVNFVRKTSDYRDTLLNRLEAMNLVAGTVWDCSQGFDLEELLESSVVFEFGGLSRDVQNFLMEILFASVYEFRLAQNHRDSGLRHVFFLDEGKRVFSVYKERQDAAGLPEIDVLTAKMREFGEGLVVADQEASKLTDSIKANTFTKLLLSTGDRKQFEAMTESMNLSERQRRYAERLGTGEAVFQSGSRGPVPVKLKNYTLEKTVTNQDLEKHQKEKRNNLSHTKRRSTQKFKDRLTPGKTTEETEIPSDPKKIDLDQESIRLLKDIVENPFKPLTKRYDLFSSRYKGNKAKNTLVEQSVVIPRHVRSSKGNKMKLFQFTDKGRDYAENELELDTEIRGRGGIRHQYWQHKINEMFQVLDNDWDSEIEVFDADVYVNTGETELAVEVAMGNNPREIDHIKKHLEKGLDNVWVTAPNQEILDGLKERLKENDLQVESVTFRPLQHLKPNDFKL